MEIPHGLDNDVVYRDRQNGHKVNKIENPFSTMNLMLKIEYDMQIKYKIQPIKSILV